MAKLVSTDKVAKYVVELTQDEAELILMLVGHIIMDSTDNAVQAAADSIWNALDEEARGDRLQYNIGGKNYDADTTIKEEN